MDVKVLFFSYKCTTVSVNKQFTNFITQKQNFDRHHYTLRSKHVFGFLFILLYFILDWAIYHRALHWDIKLNKFNSVTACIRQTLFKKLSHNNILMRPELWFLSKNVC